MKKSFLSYAIAGIALIAFVSCSDSIEANLADNEFLAAEEEAFISERLSKISYTLLKEDSESVNLKVTDWKAIILYLEEHIATNDLKQNEVKALLDYAKSKSKKG